MIKAIEKDHVCVRRDGKQVPVRLAAYKKKGNYKVSKGPNVVSAEVTCATLDEVMQYASKGYMIRMHSEIMEFEGKRRRINGLYSSDNIEVIR
ncbi:hypothetical protein GGR90_001747 [Sphingopyxis italica]|uniref:Uncharacterized protein n=1 Tax=Sphingopyxis italica TaxID=1129133 RepID=A0A7X5XTJ1_9SPHN|nr:hypothetical protein [Sphingopyxis italica]NJB89572.1 hypothetical protein [Sphingopyxis italica]